jgi:nickel transport protein
MKMKLSLFFLFAILGAGIVLPGKMYAHGVEVYDLTGDSERAVGIVCFKYSTGEPMMYAKVKLYPPSRPGVESLQSVTDRNGLFCFIPDEAGEWRVDAEDGMGHKGTIIIGVPEALADVPLDISPDLSTGAASQMGAASKTSKTGREGAVFGNIPRPLGIVLGLSLILNIFSGWHFAALFLGSRKKAVYAHQ